ncbi:hypothetical protein CR513_15304, partial [Mucuna pruriens]
MKHTFLEKFFLASKAMTIQKEICGIQQHERFNRLCVTCPHHQINEQLLIQYFYEGLMMMDHSMIDAASGGAVMDKTPIVARHLISNMFGTRGAVTNRVMNEVSAVDNLRLENQLTELNQPASINPTSQNLWNMHFYGAPNRHVDNTEIVGATGGNQYGRSRQYAVPRFGSVANMLAPNHNYYQQSGPRYPVPLFQQ